MLAVQIGSIRQEVQTWDEAMVLAAGYSYWKTGDYRMNRETPAAVEISVRDSAPLHGPQAPHRRSVVA